MKASVFEFEGKFIGTKVNDLGLGGDVSAILVFYLVVDTFRIPVRTFTLSESMDYRWGVHEDVQLDGGCEMTSFHINLISDDVTLS
jgi:hypothetical protein